MSKKIRIRLQGVAFLVVLAPEKVPSLSGRALLALTQQHGFTTLHVASL